MTSRKLLDILNDTKYPELPLKKLEEAGFAFNDKTIEGESLLHVYRDSIHLNEYYFEWYLTDLIKAGADINAVNAQEISVFEHYLDSTSSYLYKALGTLLSDNQLKLNLTDAKGVTLVEKVLSRKFHFQDTTVTQLLKHPHFDPEQTTSKHGKLIHYLVKEDLMYVYEFMHELLKRGETDPNIVDEKGQSALAAAIAAKKFKLSNIVKSFCSNKKFNINALDADGNNFAHLTMIHRPCDREEICGLLAENGINLLQRNLTGKSCLDLIFNEKYVSSNDLKMLHAILRKKPTVILENLTDNQSLVCSLFKIRDNYSYEATKIIEILKTLPEGDQALEKAASEILEEYGKGVIKSEILKKAIFSLLEYGTTIDINRLMAICMIKGKDYYSDEALKKLSETQQPNMERVAEHIAALTPPESAEYMAAMSEIHLAKLKGVLTLDCFDEDVLALEEGLLRKKVNKTCKHDTKMLAHLFSLEGSAPDIDESFELTGSNSSISGWFLIHLMNAYVKHCRESGKFTEYSDAIQQARNIAVKAYRYSELCSWSNYYKDVLNIPKQDIIAAMLKDSAQHGLEIITGWSEHAISLVIRGNTLYRSNGGGCSTDATTEEYEISKPENLTADVINILLGDSTKHNRKTYIQGDLHAVLGLKLKNKHKGKFQTVGNCSFESRRIALLPIYQLFLPDKPANEIYADTLSFFENYYLQEYLKRYHNNPILPHILMRLILTRLIPGDNLALAATLIRDHFKTEAQLEILQMEVMLAEWKLQIARKDNAKFTASMKAIGVTVNPVFNLRVALLGKVLANGLKLEDLDNLKTWKKEDQVFQGYHLCHLAVMNNNLDQTELILNHVPDVVNMTDWHDMEPLCHAKTPEMVELLVKHGAYVERSLYDNALDQAIKANDLPLVLAMLKAGVKPSEYSTFYAASRDPKILSAVIEAHPASVERSTHNLQSALHAAAAGGHTDNVRTLIYYGGANPARQDVNGISPLELALKHGKMNIARDLIDNPLTLFKRPHRGDSAMESLEDETLQREMSGLQKQREADLAYFEQFLKRDPGVIKQPVDKLILAIRCHDERAVRGCLLADPTLRVVQFSEHYGNSPLAEAILQLPRKSAHERTTRLGIIQLLFKTPGIDVNARIATSEPLIFMATSMDDAEVLELFLADPKLQVNLQDNVGYTALHDAAERGHVECVKRLLQDKRINVGVKNEDGQTAAQVTKRILEGRLCKEAINAHQPTSTQSQAFERK